MGHESLIMQHSDINSISDAIKDCLRCGKCKPVCATHVPRANLLYSPRNKILATSLLIEAFLYEEQTRRGVSIRHFDEFSDVADHCTVCHKCEKPCPVDIDFGDVSMAMRDLLRRMGKKRFNAGTAAAMFFLNATNPETIKLARKAMLEWGFKAQRLGNRVLGAFASAQTARPPATTGKPPLKEQVVHFVNKKMPGGLPKKTARALLDIEDRHYVPIIRDPARTSSESEAVFYFPGCGSERLFSQVGLATQAMLWHVGVQTVLPPGYLCCGYPQRGAGQFDKAEKIITDNRVLFHRVANTLNYLDIRTVVVSCGTCYDQLQGYKFDEIFPGCRIIDIHEYLMERGVQLAGVTGVRYMYHDPCHSPIKGHDPLQVVNTLLNDKAQRPHREERPLLRRVGHVRDDASRRRDAGALPQGAGDAGGRGALARRRLQGRSEGPDVVSVVHAGPEALQRRCGPRRRLHRRRDRAPRARPAVAAGIRARGEQRRHRTRTGMKERRAHMKKQLVVGHGAVACSVPRAPERRTHLRASSSTTGWSRPRRRSASGRAGASRSASWSAAGFPASSRHCSQPRPASSSSSRIRDDIAKQAANVDAAIGFCTPELVAAGKSIRWIQLVTAGVENCVAIPGVRERDILVTNMQRIGGPIIAEHVMGMVLAFTRGIDVYVSAQPRARMASQHAAGPHGRRRRQDHAGRRASAASAAKWRSARTRSA